MSYEHELLGADLVEHNVGSLEFDKVMHRVLVRGPDDVDHEGSPSRRGSSTNNSPRSSFRPRYHNRRSSHLDEIDPRYHIRRSSHLDVLDPGYHNRRSSHLDEISELNNLHKFNSTPTIIPNGGTHSIIDLKPNQRSPSYKKKSRFPRGLSRFCCRCKKSWRSSSRRSSRDVSSFEPQAGTSELDLYPTIQITPGSSNSDSRDALSQSPRDLSSCVTRCLAAAANRSGICVTVISDSDDDLPAPKPALNIDTSRCLGKRISLAGDDDFRDTYIDHLRKVHRASVEPVRNSLAVYI